MPYPTIFADYRLTSFQDETTQAAGDVLWFASGGDGPQTGFPSLIIVTEKGLAVQLGGRVRMLKFDGSVAWEEERNDGMAIFAHDNGVFYRGRDTDLYAMDIDKNSILSKFAIPVCYDRGGVQLIAPRGENHFIIQTYNRAEEVENDVPPEKNTYYLVLKGPDNWNDWDWIHEFEGVARHGLVTGDRGKLILLNENSQVMVFDAETGKSEGILELEGAGFVKASLDHDDNLVVTLITAEGKYKLRNYTLAGELNREFNLPDEKPGIFKQPPATDSDNRVYYFNNASLLVIEKGELQWKFPVAPTSRIQYVTILGDNSSLVAAGNTIRHLDWNGEVLFTGVLDANEEITTPPVVDTDGRIYIGTIKGIYCLE